MLRAALDLFLEVADLPAAERERVLTHRCAQSPALRARVEAMMLREADSPPLGERSFKTGGGARVAMDLERRHDHVPMPMLRGRYRVLTLLGEGGMGTVYEAEQVSPRRLVALKALRATVLGSEQALRRFALEADVLARLQHPSIAQVYEAGFGEDDGVGPAWIAMELVRGRPLVLAAQERRLDQRARLTLFLDVCEAVAFAHQKGVIHRDLKPGNILLTEPEGDAPLGRVKVLDFGVARVIGGEWDVAQDLASQLTGPGQLIGTLPYMSPEQVSGDVDAVDIRTDVYALGVILYELLAGKRPFDFHARPLDEALRVIRDTEPPLPSTRAPRSEAPSVCGDLDAIALKALAKDPSRRYQSVSRFADDVRAHLRGEPITARAGSAWYIVRRRARRFRVHIAVGLLATLGVITFAVRAGLDAEESDRLAKIAQRAEAETERARAALAVQLSNARLEQARLLSANGNLGEAAALLRRESQHRNDDSMRWALRDLAARHSCIVAWSAHTGVMHLTALMAEASVVVSAAEDGLVMLSGLDGMTLACSQLDSPIMSGALDPWKDQIVVGLADGCVVTLDAWTLAERDSEWRHAAPVSAIACFNGTVASAATDGSVVHVSTSGGLRVLPQRVGAVRAIALFDHDTVIVGDSRGAVTRIDVGPDGSSDTARIIARHDAVVGTIAVDRIRGRVISGSADRMLRSTDLERIEAPMFAADSANGTVRVVGVDEESGDIFGSGWWAVDRWDSSLIAKRRITSPPTGATTAQFDLAHGLIVTGDAEGTVSLWAVHRQGVNAGGVAIPPLAGRCCTALSRDGRRLVAGDSEGRVVVCDVTTGAVRAELPSHQRRVRAATFHPSGNVVATIADDGWLQLCDARDGQPIARRNGFHPQSAASIRFSPNGRVVAATCADYSVRIMTVPSLDPIAVLPSGGDEALAVAWSPDGSTLVTTCRDGTVCLWSAAGVELARIDVAETPWTPAFSPDGSMLAIGGWARAIDIHDARTLAWQRRLTGSAGLITDVAWLTGSSSLDGHALVLGASVDGEVRIWDPADARIVFSFEPFAGKEVVSCSVNADATIIAASGSSGEAATWTLARWDDWVRRGLHTR